MTARILPLIAAGALATAYVGTPAQAQIVPTPRASVLVDTPASRPFLAAAAAAQPLELAARGYVESEYTLSGLANVYDWDAAGSGVVARGSAVPYATRLLVRRPADARRFSGLVILELLNPTALHDTAPVWSLAQEEALRAGHAWAGLTIKPTALTALQTYDPTRYGKLSFAYQQPAACAVPAPMPGAPGSERAAPGAQVENGLAWDAIAQAGALLRSGSRENPLRELEPRRIVAAGFGESANYLITFLNARHAKLRLGDGAPIFDAYLQIAGGLADAPLNQCLAPLPAEDPRRRIGRRDAPVFSVMSETEVPRTLPLRREDSDEREDYYRLFEVAGTAHSSVGDAGRPGVREQGLLGVAGGQESPCVEPQGELSLAPAVGGVLLQIQQLLLQQTAPAHAPLISIDPEGRVARDALGNALGGLRLPQMQVPLASYAPSSTARRRDNAASIWRCSLTGTLRRFDSVEMKRLYGTRAEYLRRFQQAVDQAVEARFVTSADGAAMKAAIGRTAPVF